MEEINKKIDGENNKQSNLTQFTALRRALKAVESCDNNENKEIKKEKIKKYRDNKWIRPFYKVQKNKIFKYFISLIIILNTLILALDKYPID